MPKPRFRKTALCLVALLGIALYTATRGNVIWRVHQHYPNAQIDLRAEGNPESSFGGVFCRAFGMRYFSPFETVGIWITDHPTSIDFKHFRGMLITFSL